MPYRPHGKARVDPDHPTAWGICDRCSRLWNLCRLQWQYDYANLTVVNTRLLVCEDCLDAMNPQFRNVPLPADPVPVRNARPEPYMLDEVDYLSTQDEEPITTQDDIEIVTNQPSQNFSEDPS